MYAWQYFNTLDLREYRATVVFILIGCRGTESGSEYHHVYMSHTENDAHVAVATCGNSQCHSLHNALGHQPKGAVVLWKRY